MASDSSFEEHYHGNPFNNGGLIRCNRCDTLIPCRSLSEHLQLQCKVIKREQDYDDDFLFRTKQSQSRKDDENDFFDPAIRRDNGQMEENCDFESDSMNTVDGKDSVFNLRISTDALGRKVGRRARSNSRCADLFRARQANLESKSANNPDSIFGRRKKIPTAHELFNNCHSISEMRTQNLGNDDGSLNENTPQHHEPSRRSASTSRVQVIPDNFKQCQFCLNIMHEDYLQSHIERQHPVETGGSLSRSKVDGDSARKKVKKDRGQGKGKAGKADKDKENFRRCKLCGSFMHIHYMPGHMVRKHKTEHVGSIGILWSQYSDDQLNELLKDNRIYVKDGIAFVNKDGFDEK